MEFSLGRFPSVFDARDYNLVTFMPKGILKLSAVTEKNWEFPSSPLNQETTNHCVGFSMADFGINLPIQDLYNNDIGHKFYYMCKEIDGDPANEEGSNIRSAAKVLKQVGRIEAYAFAPNIEAIKWWILNRSPMIVGTIWTEGMFTSNSDNIIEIAGKVAGGHAYLINEWTKGNYLGIQNSWGYNWGINGKAYISAVNFEKIFKYNGEAIAAVELPLVASESKKSCLFPFFK
jgi:hypothetical protein